MAAGVKGQTLFFLGLVIIAAYLPLVLWRRWRDGAGGSVDLTSGATAPGRTLAGATANPSDPTTPEVH